MLSERINKDTPLFGDGRPPRVVTSTYPVRYAAADAPGHLVVFEPDENGMIHPAGFQPQPAASWMSSAGREMAVFAEGVQNRDFPGTHDGIHVEIRSQIPRLGGFILDATASVPSLSRHRLLFRESFSTLPEALDAAEGWIERARKWVAGRLSVERVVVVFGRRMTMLRSDEGILFFGAMSDRPLAVVREPNKVEIFDALGISRDASDPEISAELEKAVADANA
jgi:hypothetical protein